MFSSLRRTWPYRLARLMPASTSATTFSAFVLSRAADPRRAGDPPGKRFAPQCAIRDLCPPVCELSGQPVPESVEGTSLVPVLRGRRDEVHEAMFGYFTDRHRMIGTLDGWKRIWYPRAGRMQLFRVTHDPDELNDLSADPAHAERLRKMGRALRVRLRD